MSNAIYLYVEGVAGECAESQHEGWIDVFSCSWGASQNTDTTRGGGGGSGRVSFRDLNIVTTIDNAMPTMLKMCSIGQHISNVKVSVCKASGGSAMEFATFVLKNALITDVNIGGSNGSQMLVTYKFQASAVEAHYWKQQSNGGKGAEVAMGFDIKQNKITG
ncbi:type VI secretion system tube protein Hcp [Brenneria goodwinii]|uniref:Hcp family type VI secretion system effector n=1 Tax=Brenneria goodwinii TaxID=1109412 RepID=UPI000EF24CC4|nr:type VI secretion system tube protein Hcp [Brenneria goodwinii]MCG8158522.1 type VI secretion system tube protein Hcp [Brenneria goodwinii]MCG8161196.1 type VI secretion system tube protein Hcp [Brenneria goodwinii]MCG8168182.1 type VI secretion system tube protein Hcp [Brenneria goodwinii]MCG8171259.1 type VI secretion system tube protein Hcp [Brenneria goodwinii]MCG8176332.1 type VI secretion system tube protein Hcp [Brenneria goodwinii]